MKNLDKYISLLNGEVDGLLLTSPYSRYYGAEFEISEGVAIVTKKGCRYFTDSRYIESAQNHIQRFAVVEVNRDYPYSRRINDAIAHIHGVFLHGMCGESAGFQCLVGAGGKVGNGVQQCAVEVCHY